MKFFMAVETKDGTTSTGTVAESVMTDAWELFAQVKEQVFLRITLMDGDEIFYDKDGAPVEVQVLLIEDEDESEEKEQN